MKVNLLIFASSLLLLSCGEKTGRGNALAECAVETIGTTTVELNSSYPASIRGKQDVEIRPQVSGFITKVCVDEGELVRKGQVLFVIDKVQYEAAYNSAVAAVNTAKASVSTQEITVKNKRELNKKNIISDYDLAMAENTLAGAKAQLASAEAMLASAKQNLSFTDVKSPSDGIVSTIPYRLGSLVSPSIATPLTIVSDISEMYVYASITEKDLLKLVRSNGNQQSAVESYPEVSLQLSDGSMYGEKGKLETISGVIDQTTGSVRIRATFPNEGKLLRSGGMGNMIIPYNMEDVIVLPQGAFSEIQDKKFVFVLKDDNTVSMKQVDVFNLDNGKDYVVLSGLEKGEKVVVENASVLHDGQTISPKTSGELKEKYNDALELQSTYAN